MSYDTIADIQHEVWTLLKDPNGRLAPADDIIAWWFEAEKQYALKTLFFRKSTTALTTLPGVREITLPTDFIKPISVILYDTTLSVSSTMTLYSTPPWTTEPVITPVSNTLIEETFTLYMYSLAHGNYHFRVTGSISGVQAADHLVENTGWPGATPVPDEDYTTASNANGIGKGLTFRLQKPTVPYPNPDIIYYSGDTIEITVDLGDGELEEKDVKDMDAASAGRRFHYDKPSEYNVIGSDSNTRKMGFNPVPDETYPLYIEYACLPTKKTEGAPNVPLDDRERLIDWVLHKAWYQSRNFDKALLYKNQFNATLNEMAIAQRVRRDRPARITYRYKHGWRR